MSPRRPLPALLAALALLGPPLALVGCGTGDAIDDPAPDTSADASVDDAYRLTVRSTQGGTDAIRASLCGTPSTRLVVLPCGISLAFARASAPRLYVARVRDRLSLELQEPASAIFVSLNAASGERGLTRRSALVRLGRGRRASIGYGLTSGDYPTVAQPTFLSVLVVYEDPMPVPRPAPAGVPEDATVDGATVEYLVELAAHSRADLEPGEG